MTDTTTGKVAAQLSKNALWCDAFGQRFRDDSGGYQPGQFSPTGAQLIRHGKDFHDPDCSQDRESKMVEAAPGVHCDPCIAPIVAALNASGIATVASCCGHTRRPGVISLADGRELFIASDYLEARKIDAMFPVGINGEAAMTDTLEQRARGLLASEFPLADGFSAVLVRDMSIPQLGVVDTAIALRAIVAALQAQQPACPDWELIGYEYQHEETGLTTFVDVQQVEWGFEKNNPRHQRVGPCYRPNAKAQQPGAQVVAWHTDDHLTDKSATTYDPVIADRWRAKGWPVTPHYTDPQPPSIPEPSELRKVAKRCLRSYIENGSDDKALMLKCLEELS